MSEAIRVGGLKKTYNGRAVVNGLNISVKKGTVFGFLGTNGAGKSTTIECMVGTKKLCSSCPYKNEFYEILENIRRLQPQLE